MSETQEHAVQFDPHRHPWPDGIVSWGSAGYQPRDMSWGYLETTQGRVHVQAGDWIVTNSKGEKRVEKTYEPPANEITRVVAIEHAGEKIHVTVHVYLTQEEIERIVMPAVLKSLSRQLRLSGKVVIA